MSLDTPEQGGRVVLTRVDVGDAEVVYDVDLHVRDGSWSSQATIAVEGGAIAFTDFAGEGDPPPWLVEMARAFLRTVWSGRRKEDPPIWPRRLRRWRAPKD